MLRCGFYEADITPGIGSDRPGSFRCRPITEICEKLYAHAFAMQADGEPLIMISMDAIMLEQCDVDRIREGISLHTGIPADNICVFAIHLHTAGPVADSYGEIKREEPYCSYMVAHAVDAGIMAWQNMAEARIGFARCEVEGLAFNRRYLMKDGTVKMNPGELNPDIVRGVDVTDPQLSVLRVDHADGTPMGMLVNFSLHPDTVKLGSGAVSADYPGEIKRCLRAGYGAELGYVYMTGACGNVNHVDVTKPREERLSHVEIGQILAKKVIGLADQIETKTVDTVRFARTKTTCCTRRPTQEECARVKEEHIRQEMIKASVLPQEQRELEVWSVQLGETVIHVLPGEVFTGFGLDIKAGSRFEQTIVCELGHCNIGYIYTREAAQQGGYEATPTTYIIMNEDTGYRLVEAALENEQKL